MQSRQEEIAGCAFNQVIYFTRHAVLLDDFAARPDHQLKAAPEITDGKTQHVYQPAKWEDRNQQGGIEEMQFGNQRQGCHILRCGLKVASDTTQE